MRPFRRTIIIAAIVIALLAAAVGAPMFLKGLQLPTINDVSTDLVDPPAFETLTVPPYPPAFADQQRTGYPDLQTLIVDAPQQELFRRALESAQSIGCELAANDPANGRIEAVATTALMRFKDDIVIRLTARDGGVAIDVRSRSRVRRNDFGANAERIRQFLTSMEQ